MYLEARTKADPPFDFAQGRLFGDDNWGRNDNRNATAKANGGVTGKCCRRKADFSTARLAKDASSFGRNDGFFGCRFGGRVLWLVGREWTTANRELLGC